MFVIICKTSKKKLFIPGNKRYSIEDWAYVLNRQFLLNDWDCPYKIISNRDPKFISSFWKGLWKTFQTKLFITIVYHL